MIFCTKFKGMGFVIQGIPEVAHDLDLKKKLSLIRKFLSKRKTTRIVIFELRHIKRKKREKRVSFSENYVEVCTHLINWSETPYAMRIGL